MLIHYEYNYYHTSDEAVRPRQGKGGYSTTLEKEKKAESAGAMKHSSNHAATEDGAVHYYPPAVHFAKVEDYS
jgi:hypothetical protein